MDEQIKIEFIDDAIEIGSTCPQCEGTGYNEATLRLYRSFHSTWCHDLTEDEVDVLWQAGRLWDFKERPTAPQVNAWSYVGFGHDVVNRHLCVQTRSMRLSLYGLCARCGGAQEIVH